MFRIKLNSRYRLKQYDYQSETRRHVVDFQQSFGHIDILEASNIKYDTPGVSNSAPEELAVLQSSAPTPEHLNQRIKVFTFT